MQWNEHARFSGTHAFLSASQYHWIRYDDEALLRRWQTAQAAKRGDELHALAAQCIRHGIKLQKSKSTLNSYVNDAIGFGMDPERILFYSPNCFGTADAIKFSRNELRIHDLKTGVTPAKFDQLYVYAALFELEYDKAPNTILRIYQNDEVQEEVADRELVQDIKAKIIRFDKIINAEIEKGLLV